MSLPQRFNDSRYKNWLKCGNSLISLKECLHMLVDTEIKELHRQILAEVNGSDFNTCCNSCSSEDIHQVPARGHNAKKWIIPCKICSVWVDEILAFHTNAQYKHINWENSEISLWATEPYEIAKIFMPKSIDKTKSLPEDLDLPAVLALLKNCKVFSKYNVNIYILNEITDIRNRIHHSGDFRVSDQRRDSWIDKMLQFVTHLNLQGTIYSELCMVKTDQVDISAPNMEIRVLQDTVSSLGDDIQQVKTEMSALVITQNQFAREVCTVRECTKNTNMRTDLMCTDLSKLKHHVSEVMVVSEKITTFLKTNRDISDQRILSCMRSNEEAINKLQCKQSKTVSKLSAIKSNVSLLQKQVEKNKYESRKVVLDLGKTMEGQVDTKVHRVSKRLDRMARKHTDLTASFFFSFCVITLDWTWFGARVLYSEELKNIDILFGDFIKTTGILGTISGLVSLICAVLHFILYNGCFDIIKNKRKRRCLGTFYHLFLWVMMVYGAIHLILLDKLNVKIETEHYAYLQKSIKDTYEGTNNSKDPFSLSFDKAQEKLHCCGLDHYTDFDSASKWNRTLSSKETLLIPTSCCEKYANGYLMRVSCPLDGLGSYKNKPCWEVVLRLMQTWLRPQYLGLVMQINTAVMIQLFVCVLRIK